MNSLADECGTPTGLVNTIKMMNEMVLASRDEEFLVSVNVFALLVLGTSSKFRKRADVHWNGSCGAHSFVQRFASLSAISTSRVIGYISRIPLYP